jgi:hypothetical protein
VTTARAFTVSEPGYRYLVTEAALLDAIAVAVGEVDGARLAGRRAVAISLELGERTVRATVRIRVVLGEVLPAVGELVRARAGLAVALLCGTHVAALDVDIVGLEAAAA